MSKLSTTDLQKIYTSGTAKQLWEAWDEKMRTHFLIDHAGQFFELMGDDYNKSAKAYNTLTFDTLPAPIRKELVIHHAMGMYKEGGEAETNKWRLGKKRFHTQYNVGKTKYLISYHKGGLGDKHKDGSDFFDIFQANNKVDYEKFKKKLLLEGYAEEMAEGGTANDEMSESETKMYIQNLSEEDWNRLKPENQEKYRKYRIGKIKTANISSSKQKMQDRINILKETQDTASPTAQKAIQAKIDKLQAKLDYKPTAKQLAQDNKGRFAMDVPTKYSKAIYKKLWSMKIMPRIHKLNGTASIVVSSRNNLDKAYKVYSDISTEKVLPLAKISRKL